MYVDLGDESYRAVRIDTEDWEIIDSPPVKFRRPDGMRPLPVPIRGGTLEDLRPLINVKAEEFILVVAWLAAALRTLGSYAIAVLIGEYGTAKTSLGKLLRSLVDPSAAPLRGEPKSEQDLVIAANNSNLLAYDNISRIQQWLSDALCRVSTGGGLSTRKLYTDDEESIFEVLRPILMTGIVDFVKAGDLLDRSIFFNLQTIPPEKLLTEKQYRKKVDALRPSILGSLFDAISGGLELMPEVEAELGSNSRLGDFGVFGESVSRAIGNEPGTFLSAYRINRADANAASLEGNSLVDALRKLAAKGAWVGQAGTLLKVLTGLVGETTSKSKFWPKDATRISGTLRLLAPKMRAVGVDITFEKNYGEQKLKVIHVRPIQTPGVQPGTATI